MKPEHGFYDSHCIAIPKKKTGKGINFVYRCILTEKFDPQTTSGLG